MEARTLIQMLEELGIDFFTGVPDSLLSGLCNHLMNTVGMNPSRHIIAHNEGGCVALAAGHYLATGKVPCVYMQNSGIGNAVNPVSSLTHSMVYGIPTLFIIGWRGEPDVEDEPQHLFQGAATLDMLRGLEVETVVLEKATSDNEVFTALECFRTVFLQGKSAAIVVRKGALQGPEANYGNDYILTRESVVQQIARAACTGVLVSTTGKISRELYEYREQQNQAHDQDFLTVGSMGHSVMIALGIAQTRTDRRIWCLDGDGAVLMHMGALATVGGLGPDNLLHVVLNNAAHESVGGVPTVAGSVNISAIAKACGYRAVLTATSQAQLEQALAQCACLRGPVFLEVKVSLGSRQNLGRPTTKPAENKAALMAYLQEVEA